MSSRTPTRAIAKAPIRIAWLSPSLGRKTNPATTAPPRIPSPPSFGVGTVCSERSLGWSIAPIRTASCLVSGTEEERQHPGDKEGEEGVEVSWHSGRTRG